MHKEVIGDGFKLRRADVCHLHDLHTEDPNTTIATCDAGLCGATWEIRRVLEMVQTISGKTPKIVAPAAAGHIPTSEEIRAFLQVKTGMDTASLTFADNTTIKVICDRIACF